MRGFFRLDSRAPGTRELFGLCFVVGFAFASWAMAGPLVPLLLLDLEASPGVLGTVVSVSVVGSILVAVPGGTLVNRWGTRKLMFRSGLLSAVSCLFMAAFPTIVGLFVGLAFMEIGKLLFILGAQAHVSNLGQNRDLNLDFGWYGMAAAIGQMAGPFVSGLCIDHAGKAVTWIVIAGFGSVTIAFLPSLVSPGMVAPGSQAKTGKRRKNLRYYLNTYAVMAILASFAVVFADGARTTFYPVLLKSFGYSATVIGVFLSLRALVSMSVRLFMAWFIRFAGGRFQALIVSLFIMSLGIAATPFCTGYFLLVLNAVLVGIGIGMSLPLSMAMVSEGVEPEDRGVAMGIRLTGNRLAQFVNPVFFGLVAEAYSLSTAFFTGGLFLAAAGLPIAVWWRGESRRKPG